MLTIDQAIAAIEKAPAQILMSRGLLPCGLDGDYLVYWQALEKSHTAFVGWLKRYQNDAEDIPPEVLFGDPGKGVAHIYAMQSLIVLRLCQSARAGDPTGVLCQYSSAAHHWGSCEYQNLESMIDRSGLLGGYQPSSKDQSYANLRSAVKFLQQSRRAGQLISEAQYRERFGSAPGHIGRLLAVCCVIAEPPENVLFRVELTAKLRDITRLQRLIERSKGIQLAKLDDSGKLQIRGVGKPPRVKQSKGFVTKS